jgi:hypothetical protein
MLHVDPEAGLTRAEVEIRRKENGYNEVAVQKGHPVLAFLAKFWGLSAWMLELIIVLSAVLHKFSDLAVVSALLIVSAVWSLTEFFYPSNPDANDVLAADYVADWNANRPAITPLLDSAEHRQAGNCTISLHNASPAGRAQSLGHRWY